VSVMWAFDMPGLQGHMSTPILFGLLAAFALGYAVALWRLDFRPHCVHEWRYFADADATYTGYLERCAHCGAVRQVVQ